MLLLPTPATITSIEPATPTVKTLSLRITDPNFGFLAGQWVDFLVAIDGRQEVAGYSITSSPLQRGCVELAVKNEGGNPVTRYVHERAKVGDRVTIAVGGNVWYRRELSDSLVLIAGGIGINPIMSILRYLDDAAPQVRATLLYSVRTPAELLYGEDIRQIAQHRRNLRAHFTVTRSQGHSWQGDSGRIDDVMLNRLRLEREALYYLCGPPAMVADVRAYLGELGIDAARIRFESWYEA